MSAMPAPATGHPVDASPARPRRWISPHRRDRIAPHEPIRPGPEQTALLFTELLATRFCRWPGSYCLWAENATIEERLGLTSSQVKRWLSHAEKSGRLIRFRGPAQFERWLELTGVPDYGLDPAGPPNMHCPCRVIVLTDLLPERIRPEGLYGPIGLDVDGADVRHGMVQECTIEQAISAPSHPIWKLEGKEEMKLELGESSSGSSSGLSLLTDEEQPESPQSSHRTAQPIRPSRTVEVDVWPSIPADDQTRLLETVYSTKQTAYTRTLPMLARANAVALWQAEHPELFTEAPGAETEPPRPAPVVPAVSAPSPLIEALPGVYVGRATEPAVRRVLGELVEFTATPADDDEFRIGAYADHLSVWLLDNTDGSNRVFRARIRDCLKGREKPPTLSIRCLLYAVLHAMGPGTYSRTAKFSGFIKKHRDRFPVEGAEKRGSAVSPNSTDPRLKAALPPIRSDR